MHSHAARDKPARDFIDTMLFEGSATRENRVTLIVGDLMQSRDPQFE